MSRIISIGTAVPQYYSKQSALLEFMNSMYTENNAHRKLNVLFQKSGIETRYSVVSDFNGKAPDDILFGRSYNTPDIRERLDVFRNKATPLAVKAINCSLEKLNRSVEDFKISHLITVSCTGLQAPGLDAEIIESLNLPSDIFHLQINFLGCNAAFSALKIADMIIKSDDNAKVLVVCVEFCTLHFQPKNNDDNLLSNSIFGDGVASAVLVSDAYAKSHNYKGLRINGFYSLLLNKGKHLMGWNVKPVNFEMILNADVPEFIGDSLDEIMVKASAKLKFTQAEINKWAVHPGGKKILDTIRKKLNIEECDLQYSYKILKEYGNMSSATILFVLNEIMNALHNPEDKIFSLGFGPGLSIETSLLQYAE